MSDIQDLDRPFFLDSRVPPQDVIVRVAPGQDEAMWRDFFGMILKLPGGIAEIRSEVMTAEEAARFKGLASWLVVPHEVQLETVTEE